MQPWAERLVLDYLQLLSLYNSEGYRGIPDTFISVEESIRFLHGIEEQDAESFQGSSHTCQVAIDFLARRWQRRPVSLMWEGITRLSLDSSIPQLPWEWFIWRADSAAFVQEAETPAVSTLPQMLVAAPEFAFFFALVFPHRLTPVTFAAIDKPS